MARMGREKLQQKAERIASNAGRARQAQFAAAHPKAAARAGVRARPDQPRQTINMLPQRPQAPASQIQTTPDPMTQLPGLFGGAMSSRPAVPLEKPTKDLAEFAQSEASYQSDNENTPMGAQQQMLNNIQTPAAQPTEQGWSQIERVSPFSRPALEAMGMQYPRPQYQQQVINPQFQPMYQAMDYLKRY